MNRLERLKNSIYVGLLMYRKEIRKKMLKLLILLNFVLFFLAVMNNLPSMILFVLNMYYLYNYMKSEYPEENMKGKDRFNGMDQK